MLISLTVRNFVLIDELTLELGRGLHVLSGETGAGKSILIDALALVLGGRASPDVIRTGKENAEVEAVFDVSDSTDLSPKLQAAGLAPDDLGSMEHGELIVRRTVASNGRSRAFINGRQVTAAQLSSLMRGLVDISSQHESQTLCDVSTHLDLLDTYGGLLEPRRALTLTVEELVQVSTQIADIRAAADATRAKEDLLRFQLQELDEFGLRLGEDKELEQQRSRLRHAEKLSMITRTVSNRLDAGEEPVLDQLRRAYAEMGQAAQLDESLAPHLEVLERSMSELSDVAHALSRYCDHAEADPAQLSEIEERLFKMQKLLKKHGPTVEEALKKRDQVFHELDQLDLVDGTVEELEASRDALLIRAAEQAQVLSQKRREIAQKLADCIAQELASLAMGRARIVVEVEPMTVEPNDADSFVLPTKGDNFKRIRLTRTGIDRVELLIAPNSGETPKPLRKIASGGELSRSLLAVKRVLASNKSAGLYVFDEVDAGVGGAVAEAIGRKIADVAHHHQVLCITHLAQIAAFADQHYAVAKFEENGRTKTQISQVEGKAQIEEIARMLGGAVITSATRKAAEEMIKLSKRTSREKDFRAP